MSVKRGDDALNRLALLGGGLAIVRSCMASAAIIMTRRV